MYAAQYVLLKKIYETFSIPRGRNMNEPYLPDLY